MPLDAVHFALDARNTYPSQEEKKLTEAAGDRQEFDAKPHGEELANVLLVACCSQEGLLTWSGTAILHAKSMALCHLLVEIPEAERKRHAYEVAIRQVYKQVEVGRVTWRLGGPKKK